MVPLKRLILKAVHAAGYTVLHNPEYLLLEARSHAKAGKRLPDKVRELTSIAGEVASIPNLSPGWSPTATGGRVYEAALGYFKNYPERSLMSDESRATLFAIIRAMRPKVVVEVGTLHAGTIEVIARALWENGNGIIHSTDPYGASRCPEAIGRWPDQLQEITFYHPLNSMDFFLVLEQKKIEIDIALIDGNHDFEFAFFDLLEAAKLLRPGGVIVMDNAEQTGPFQAAVAFLKSHPDWQELGNAIACFRDSSPFDAARASVPGTSFILLKAPDYIVLNSLPRSWGQKAISLNSVKALSLPLTAQKTAGILHYHVIFRAFGDEHREVVELKSVGSIRIDLDKHAIELKHDLDVPLQSDMQSKYADCGYTVEVELAWQPDPNCMGLAIAAPPQATG